jgi:hypothetical protein
MLPSIGSVTVTCSTWGDPLRLAIFAPNASRSYALVNTVAPSTAVKPAIASTARLTASATAGVFSSGALRVSSASSLNDGTTAYGMGRTIESGQPAPPDGTTCNSLPRPCARIDTASCTSTLTESIRLTMTLANRSRAATSAAADNRGKLEARSSTTLI